jgi:hypothetical protein
LIIVYSRKERRDGHGDVHQAGADAEIGCHYWRDVQRGLREEPERQHSEDDSEQKSIVPAEAILAAHSMSFVGVTLLCARFSSVARQIGRRIIAVRNKAMHITGAAGLFSGEAWFMTGGNNLVDLGGTAN